MEYQAPDRRRIGDFDFDPASGELCPAGDRSSPQRLEPKVAALLEVLAARPGELVGRDEIDAALWPDVVVGDDALPRCVSKLRRALGDDSKSPRYVETVPKRGYRLVAPVVPTPAPSPAVGTSQASPAPSAPSAARPAQRRMRAVALGLAALALAVLAGLAAWRFAGGDAPRPAPAAVEVEPAERLVEQADDFYIHITRGGNESAIDLYEQALAADPEYARAHAGLANALVQRVLRYPAEEVSELEEVNLGSALAAGRFQAPDARHHLDRALGLAERAVRLDPRSAASHKALGFVTSALGRLDDAERIYTRAAELDADAWDVLINLGDVLEIRGHDDAALRQYELAYEAMERVQGQQKQRVAPWLDELGVAIGERHRTAGRADDAEVWFRRVLGYSPLHPGATCNLAGVLRGAGDPAAARRMENELVERLGDGARCAEVR